MSLVKLFLAFCLCLLTTIPALGAYADPGNYVALDQCDGDSELDIQTVAFGFAGCNDDDLVPHVTLGIACAPNTNLTNYNISILAKKGGMAYGENVATAKWYQEDLSQTNITEDGHKWIWVTCWVENVSGYVEVGQVLVRHQGKVVDCVDVINRETKTGFIYTNEYGNELIFQNKIMMLRVL